jgi:excisionase family DNA binding protein
VTRAEVDELDINAAAAVVGRSAETVRRWVWSGRLPAHKRGNKLLIARSDLDILIGPRRTHRPMSLADWLAEVEGSDLKKAAAGPSAADLVLEDRQKRSGGGEANARP